MLQEREMLTQWSFLEHMNVMCLGTPSLWPVECSWGKILWPAIEAQCIYKIEGGCKCQSKEFHIYSANEKWTKFLKSELLYRCIYEHCQVN